MPLKLKERDLILFLGLAVLNRYLVQLLPQKLIFLLQVANVTRDSSLLRFYFSSVFIEVLYCS